MKKFHYYSALDTVYFRPDLPAELLTSRAVSATGVVMLDMLVGDGTPVLSQVQAFDNSLILALLAEPSPNSHAFLRLIRRNRLQVRILDTPALRDTAEHSERFTLRNAFCSALSQPGFVASAWPELNDPTARRTVVELLDAAPDRLDSLGDARLVARLEGLLELDASLRQSSAIERMPIGQGAGLTSRVVGGLTALAEGESAQAGLSTRLLDAARQLPEARTDRRSTWYTLLDDLVDFNDRTGGAAMGSAVTNLRGLIDGAYNGVVADSLGVTGSLTVTPTDEVARALAVSQPQGSTAGQLTALVRDPRRQEWLTWSKLVDVLDDCDHMIGSERRLAYILHEHREYVGAVEAEKRTGLALRIALPHAAVSILVGAAAGGLGESIGGGLGAALGAGVAGIVSLLGAHPRVTRLHATWGEKAKRNAAEKWEATVATGTASGKGGVLG